MENQDKNQRVLLIGLFLIITVILIFFSKNYFFGKKYSQEKNKTDVRLEELLKIKAISSEDLSKMITGGKPPAIFDVRDSDSFLVEHIIDSKNISHENLEKTLSSPEKNKTYVIVGYSGEDLSFNFPDSLENEEIYLLSGGFSAWKNGRNPTISFGDADSFLDQSKVSYIKSEELKKTIEENERIFYIVDVRKSGSFSGGHIKNAVNIFLDDIEKRRREIPLGKKVVVYDEDGLWSYRAAVRLFDLGVFNVSVLSGGIEEWRKKGYEVVK
ncbi:MAG TPA: rhodanese-like domain-containing protein [Candidatus Moranbacteria bacterium]|nr:rhodanese-like domain-containing protein [Candidatus Moranbacteria bacterium]